MTRLQFHLLLKRYLDNKSTPEELVIIESWYELLENENFQDISPAEFEQVEGRLWHKIQAQTIYKPAISLQGTAKVKFLAWKRLAVAMSIILTLGSVSLYFFISRKDDKSIAQLIPRYGYMHKENTGTTEMAFSLNDSSTVSLQPGATLYYPKIFNGLKREVYLDGTAFFNIKKNALKPFFVYNNNIITHVIGTSFWVKPDGKNKKIDVEVISGRVEVYENKAMVSLDQSQSKSNGVVLLPNQKVTYTQTQRKFETALVEKPVLIGSKDAKYIQPSMVFDDVPLNKVLNTLETIYGVSIVIENEAVNNCPFTGDISELDLYKQLDVLCKSIGKTYEKKGINILIKGEGCN